MWPVGNLDLTELMTFQMPDILGTLSLTINNVIIEVWKLGTY